jgi:hypothetical protein
VAGGEIDSRHYSFERFLTEKVDRFLNYRFGHFSFAAIPVKLGGL